MLCRFPSTLMRGSRMFSTTSSMLSNIGRQPVRLADSVSWNIEEIPFEFCKSFTKGKHTFKLNKQLVLKGPKGVLKLEVPQFVQVGNKDNALVVTVDDPNDKIQRSMWGTSRALISNNVTGVVEGHLSIVRFVGTGYRASVVGDTVELKIGLPYIPKLKIPEGLKVTSPNPTRLLIEGSNKQQVKLFASLIREMKKPEPYKGKGIYVDDETIKLKEKKVK